MLGWERWKGNIKAALPPGHQLGSVEPELHGESGTNGLLERNGHLGLRPGRERPSRCLGRGLSFTHSSFRVLVPSVTLRNDLILRN